MNGKRLVFTGLSDSVVGRTEMEDWPSGLRQQFRKLSCVFKAYREFESHILRHEFVSSIFTWYDGQAFVGRGQERGGAT